MKSLEYIERELEWLRTGGDRQLDQDEEIKNLENVKSDLERLEKLEKVVEILKDKFHLDILEDGYFGCVDLDYNSINPDNLPKEEYELVKEVFGE